MKGSDKKAIMWVSVIIVTILLTLGIEYLIRYATGRTPEQIEQYHKAEKEMKEYNEAVNEECQWYKDKLDSFKKPTVDYGPPVDQE